MMPEAVCLILMVFGASHMLQVQHLKAEREVLKLLDHPFVVRMLGSFQDLVCVYFVMEYVCGGEFFRHLKARGKCEIAPTLCSLYIFSIP